MSAAPPSVGTTSRLSADPASYVHVTPREHGRECRRGRHPFYGLDRARCERCANLWQRLIEVGERRARARVTA